MLFCFYVRLTDCDTLVEGMERNGMLSAAAHKELGSEVTQLVKLRPDTRVRVFQFQAQGLAPFTRVSQTLRCVAWRSENCRFWLRGPGWDQVLYF